MANIRRKSQAQELLEYVDVYRKKHGDVPINVVALAKQALKEGFRAKVSPPEILLARQFVKAMKQSYMTDLQGREVRRWHSVRRSVELDGEKHQAVLWEDIEQAKPKFMRASVQQQRGDILHDCIRLETTWESYNDNNKHGATLPTLNFDFREDMVEAKQSTEYPESKPDDVGDIDIEDEDEDEDDDGSGALV